MTKEQILADLDYASTIAREGAQSPLLGGPIGLMWGILVTAVLGYQYLVLGGIIAMPEESLAIAWITYGIIGGFGSFILNRRISQKAGASSVANRVERYVWTLFSGGLAAIIIGVILNIIADNGDQTVWNTVIVFAFAGQGMAYGVSAKMTNLKILHIASFTAFTFAAISMMMINDPVVYLIGSIGSFLTIVIPSLFMMKAQG